MNLKELFKNTKDGSVVIGGTPNSTLCAYTYVQGTALTEWVIDHDNGSTIVAIQVFVDDDMIIPDDIIINSGNKFTIKLSEPRTGVANFILQSGSSDSCGVIS